MAGILKEWMIGTGMIGALASIAIAALPIYDKGQERAELAVEKAANLHAKEYEGYLTSQTERCKDMLSYFMDDKPNSDLTVDQRVMLTDALKKGLENCYVSSPPESREANSSANSGGYAGRGGTSGGGGSGGHF